MTDRSVIVKPAAKKPKARRGRPPTPGMRAALIGAGLASVHGSGYHATGVAEIVERAAAPKGTFYAHFPSKDAFGEALVAAFAAQIFAVLLRHLSDPRQPSPLLRLRGFFEARIAHYRENGCSRGCLLGNLGLELSDNHPAIRGHIRAQLGRYAAHFADALAAAQRAGEVRLDRSSAELGRQLLRAWEGALLAMRVEQSVTPLREFVELMLGDFLRVR